MSVFEPGDLIPDYGRYDFWVCDNAYGENLILADCLDAANLLPVGDDVVPLVGQFKLPIQRHSGGCWVTIEESGNSRNPSAIARPTEFRKLARVLVDLCVLRSSVGAWSTYGFDTFVNWVSTDPNPTIPPWHAPPPVSASFFTVTVHGPNDRNPSPGNTSPFIPEAVSDALSDIFHNPARFGTQHPNIVRKGVFYNDVAGSMPKSGTTPWWLYPLSSTPDDIAYECDDNLGSPASVDCAQIEWNQLGPITGQPDTVTVGPGAITFFHSNACYLAISATMTLVLTWEQIRAAASTLIGFCVQHPYQPSQGGRAYYGTQPQQVSGRRKRQSTVNGLNALPPGANLTVFAQAEPWTNQASEAKTCTWQAVLKGQSVTTCPTS